MQQGMGNLGEWAIWDKASGGLIKPRGPCKGFIGPPKAGLAWEFLAREREIERHRKREREI